MSTRINKNGVKTEKLGLKYDSRGLFAEDLKLTGFDRRNRGLDHK
jgi:hypothetical protein